MATLDTNRTRMSQLRRSRAIADALTAQALKPRQIVHPYQGMAQLAEALAGGLLGIQVSKNEKRLADERRQAMIEALGPQYETAVLPGKAQQSDVPQQQAPWSGMVGGESLPQSPVPPSANPITGALPQGYEYNTPAQIQTSPGLYSDEQIRRLMLLPDNVQEEVLGKALLHELTPDPSKQTDRYPSVDVLTVNYPGQEPRDMHIVRDKETGLRGYMDPQQGFVPVPSQYLSDPVQKTQDVPASMKGKYAEQFAAAQSTLGEINRLGAYVAQGGLAQESGLGSAFAFAESVRSTFAGMYDRYEILIGGKPVRDTGQLAQATTFTGYNADRVTERDRRKYSDATIESNISSWEQLQTLDAATQQLAISIAYSLARIADPGGRLSEMDVLNQIRSLGLQQASIPRRLAALEEARITFADQVYNRYSNLRANGVAIEMDPTLMADITAIRNGTYPAFKASSGVEFAPYLEDPKYTDYFLPEIVDIVRGLTPEARRQYERTYQLPVGIYDYVIEGR